MAPPNSHVLRSLPVGPVLLKNRVGLGPINPGFTDNAGKTDGARVAEFYRQYAHAEIGLVYVGGVAIDQDARANSRSLTIRNANDARVFQTMADKVHDEGAVLAVQLMHAGRQAFSGEIGARTIAASPVPCDVVREIPAQATRADLRRVVKAFGNAASWATRAGIRMVEIHAAHGYLVSGFLSSSSNLRNDSYGGTVENRFRLLREIVAEVRHATSHAVGVRVNVAENTKSVGLTLAELLEGLSPILNAIDFLSVSGGVYTRGEDWIIPRRQLGPALWRQQAAAIRQATGIPVFIAGNIDSINLADQLVANDTADLVLMVRALLADPTLLKKWLAGDQTATPQPCTELLLCKYHSRGATNLYCPHNPVLRHQFRPKVGAQVGVVRQSEPVDDRVRMLP